MNNTNKPNELLSKAEYIKAQAFEPVTNNEPTKGKRVTSYWLLITLLVAVAMVSLTYLVMAKSVVIETIPEQSKLHISGGLHFALADHFLMLSGQYQVTAKAEGYYQLNQTIAVSKQQNQRFQFQLTKLPGELLLEVTPKTPIQVFIDEQQYPIENYLLKDIPAGRHELTIKAERYFSQTIAVDIAGMRSSEQLNITLVPRWAEVKFDSEPSGAEVFEQELSLGITPFTIDLLAGEHEFRFSKADYQPSIRKISVEAGRNFAIAPPKLVKHQGSLTVVTQPAGVSVTFGQQFLGQTPLTALVQPDHTFTLLLVKEGFAPQSHDVRVPAGSKIEKNYRLASVLGSIDFRVSPQDALIYVNDHLMGRANQQLTLPVKNHHIRIEKPGYLSVEQTVLPNPKLAQQFTIQLKTLEQAKWDNLPPVISAASGAQLKLFKPNDTITLGASRREQGRRANEVKRTVNITKAFYLGFTEITNQQFKQFQQQHSSGNMKGYSLNGVNQPVVQVTWQQAAQYCNWLSAQQQLTPVYHFEGQRLLSFDVNANGYRLPTEVEWVWAARFAQGKMLTFAWGDDLPPAQNSVNIADISGASILGNVQTSYNDNFPVSAPVASFPANEKGLFDLSGNVAEWLHDYYEISTGLSLKIEQDPMGPEQGSFHVIRGASWAQGTRTELRLSFRDYGNEKRNDLGFRIARNVQ